MRTNQSSKKGNGKITEKVSCSTDSRINFFKRVRSWLRMNAGGVPNTCKSSGEVMKPSDSLLSGGWVRNTWVTCLLQGDNRWKRLLIPHMLTVPHGTGRKVFSVRDGPASD